jgi:hypothetical protein
MSQLEQLKSTLRNEQKYVEQLIAVGTEEGHFLSHHGMTTSEQLTARSKTLGDVLEYIDQLENPENGGTDGNANS